jgi:hypothetical protein
MSRDKSYNEVVLVSEELSMETHVSLPIHLCNNDASRHVSSSVLWPMVWDCDGMEINLILHVIEDGGFCGRNNIRG